MVTAAIVWKVVIEVGRGYAAAALARVEELQKESTEYDARLKAWMGYFGRNEELTGERDAQSD